MALKDTLHSAMLTAMRSGDAFKRDTLRLALGALTEAETAGKTRRELSEEEEIAAVRTLVNRIVGSQQFFQEGNKPELLEKAKREVAVLKEFLPEQLSPEDTRVLVEAKVQELGLTTKRDMGKLMGALKQAKAPVDFSLVSRIAGELLPAV